MPLGQHRSSSDRNKLRKPHLLTEPNQLDLSLSSFHGSEHQTIQEGKKINIANEIRHSMMFSSGGTLISRRRQCLASAARGWQTPWISSKNTSSVVL